jgi:hypothetical protein
MELNPLLANIIAAVAIITGIALATWWVISLYLVHSRSQEEELPEIDLPGDLHETVTGFPTAVKIFIVLIAVSLILYVVYAWLGGITY